eukprot:2517176-Pyramimonas_sp.AAC.1
MELSFAPCPQTARATDRRRVIRASFDGGGRCRTASRADLAPFHDEIFTQHYLQRWRETTLRDRPKTSLPEPLEVARAEDPLRDRAPPRGGAQGTGEVIRDGGAI